MSTRRCSICTDESKLDWVARRTLEGHASSKMEALSRLDGSPAVIKRETIKKHNDVCMKTPYGTKPKDIVAEAQRRPPQTGDVAVLVQKEVIRKLEAGEARVTVQHGLQAQQLLDRRAERAKDRELAVTLARLLHTSHPPDEMVSVRPPLIDVTDSADDVTLIEGEAVEVTGAS